MGQKKMILFDSNVLISAWNEHRPSVDIVRKTLAQGPAALSIISLTEILSEIPRQDKASKALEDFNVLPFDDVEIAQKAAAIRRESGLHLPDAVIAATCEFHGCDLYTYDSDFKKLKRRWVKVLDYG